MKRKDALQALTAGGKTREVGQLIERRSAAAAQQYQQITDDAGLSEQGKRHRLAVAFTQANRDLTEDIASLARGVVRTDRDDAERVFGIRGLQGDVASLTISRRDAADRVAAVESAEELRSLLTRATRSGDEVLARAVAERAVREQDDTTVHQFCNDRPDLDSAVERLWNVERAGSNTFGINVQMMSMLPQELMGMSEADIEAVAYEGEPQAAAAGGSAW